MHQADKKHRRNNMKQNELETILAPKKAEFIEMMGNRKDAFTKELSFALQVVNGNTLLQQCDPISVAMAVYNVALTGLTLNPLMKLAYLTPRWNSKKQGNECVLMPSYQGLVKTITDTGSAKKIEAHLIMDGDEFIQEYGSEYRIIHKPIFPKGKIIIGAYAIATLSNGEKQIEVMDKSELDYIRSKSDGWKSFESGKAKSSIWNDWEGEMCKKTVIKRLVKYLPKSPSFEKVAKVIEVDNAEYPAQDWKIDKIEQLLPTAALDYNYKELINATLKNEELTDSEATNILFEVEAAQVDPIKGGLTLSAKEINKAVKLAAELPNN